MFGRNLAPFGVDALVARIGEIEVWIAKHVEAALGQPNDDILGAVARGIEAGIFTVHEACVVLHTLLSAGGESTTSLLGNAVHILALNHDLQGHLRSQPELVPAFIEEVLRLESPFPAFSCGSYLKQHRSGVRRFQGAPPLPSYCGGRPQRSNRVR